jgi:hypothetical protein
MPFEDYGATGKHTETHTEALKVAKLGTRLQLEDGRVFHYARANGALLVGQLCQGAAAVANHDEDLAVASTAIGATEVSVTFGATAITLNQYENGYLYVNNGTAEGAVYTIDSHVADAGGQAFTVPLKDDGGLRVALVNGDSTVGVMGNPWADVIQYPTTITGMAAGVSPVAVDDDAYFWCQTWGPAAIFVDLSTHAIGTAIEPSAAKAGAVDLYDRSGSVDQPMIGQAMNVAATDDEYHMFYLNIAP